MKKSKIKNKNRIKTLIVDKSKYSASGIGSTTLNDGLTFGKYPYGTRVQDENICLNVPDIIQIHSIYESLNTSDPSAPTAVLFSITSPSTTTSELIIGEKITGQTSGAIAYVKNLRLITDNYGDLFGSFFIKNPHTNPAPNPSLSLIL